LKGKPLTGLRDIAMQYQVSQQSLRALCGDTDNGLVCTGKAESA
jgi:hypothetical protein